MEGSPKPLQGDSYIPIFCMREPEPSQIVGIYGDLLDLFRHRVARTGLARRHDDAPALAWSEVNGGECC